MRCISFGAGLSSINYSLYEEDIRALLSKTEQNTTTQLISRACSWASRLSDHVSAYWLLCGLAKHSGQHGYSVTEIIRNAMLQPAETRMVGCHPSIRDFFFQASQAVVKGSVRCRKAFAPHRSQSDCGRVDSIFNNGGSVARWFTSREVDRILLDPRSKFQDAPVQRRQLLLDIAGTGPVSIYPCQSTNGSSTARSHCQWSGSDVQSAKPRGLPGPLNFLPSPMQLNSVSTVAAPQTDQLLAGSFVRPTSPSGRPATQTDRHHFRHLHSSLEAPEALATEPRPRIMLRRPC